MTPQEIHELVAPPIRLTTQKYVNIKALQRAEIIAALDTARDAMVLELDTYITGMESKRLDIDEEWPRDWWEAFRERWFPGWWLKRHPVQKRRVSVHEQLFAAVCPHVHVPSPKTHMRWLAKFNKDAS